MSNFEEFVSQSTAKEGGKLNTAIFLAVDKNGKTIYSRSSGRVSKAEDAKAADSKDAFHIASCSKLITSIAVLQSVERGILHLDESVEKWAPELADVDLIHGTAEDFTLSKPKGHITLRQLITHTSGLGYDVFQPLLIAWRKSRNEESMHSKGPIEVANKTPLLFEPGEGWEYGAGLDWAGLIVARANKTNLEDYMQENIFKPLGMNETTFHLANRPQLRERLVHIMTRNAEGGLDDIGPMMWPDPAPAESGGHGLISTPDDYLKVLVDLISPTPKLLKPQTLDSMFEPQLRDGSEALKALDANPGVGVGQFPILAPHGQPRNFGLGSFLVPADFPGVGKTKGTIVWAGFFNWVWFANKDLGVAGVFATHTLPPNDPDTMNVVDAFIKEIFARVS